jgi:hypothetical protein
LEIAREVSTAYISLKLIKKERALDSGFVLTVINPFFKRKIADFAPEPKNCN